MQFFDLTHPRYSSDAEADRLNPARPLVDWHIPSIICDECGRWAASDRLRVPLQPVASSQAFRRITFLPTGEWFQRRSEWARLLGVPQERITPGAELGLPKAEVQSSEMADFVHPSPGQIWVREKVMLVLDSAGLVGADLVPVQSSWARRSDPNGTPPRLWEIVVTGSAWRQNSDEQSIAVCNVCGRTVFPNASQLQVDETRWDGSDFFHVDGNPNIVLVTERVRDLLDDGRLSNYQCVPASKSR